MKTELITNSSPSQFEKDLKATLLKIHKEKLFDVKFQTSIEPSGKVTYSAVVIYEL